MDTLVTLSRYVNKKNVAIVMTYLYILTVLVLISSQMRLSKDFLLGGDSDRRFMMRSLSSYDKPVEYSSAYADGQERRANTHQISDRIANKADELSFDTGQDKGNNKGQTNENIKAEDRSSKQDQDRDSETKEAETLLVKERIVNTIPKAPKVATVKETEQKSEELNVKDSANSKNANANKEVIDPNKPGQIKDRDKSPNAVQQVIKEKPKLREAKSKNPYLEIIPNLEIEDNPVPKELTWQKVMSNGTLLIYTAIMESIYGEPYVRAIAINGNTFLPKFYCEMTYNNSEIVTTRGKIWMLPDHHEKTYKTVFLYCPLPDDEVPVYLSIIPIYEPVRLHRLPVLFNPVEKRNFTVCLSPLFFNVSIEFELVQWFEINRLIGVDYFIVYSYSIHPRTDEILRHYVKEGWVQIIPWDLPDYTDLHYFGQNAAVNDCMMRNYKISRYMVNIDIDELIVPRKSISTLNELMSNLPSNFCEYSFRSTFMGEESKDVYEGKQKARELNLHFMLRISRRAYIFDKAVRSKYIVNTTCIDTVGIHYCWKYRNGTIETQRYYVSPRDGLMFHFRSEPVMKTGKEIEEKAVYKYHKELIENAKERWKKINEERLEAKRKEKENKKTK